jgi:hypothetical protein
MTFVPKLHTKFIRKLCIPLGTSLELLRLLLRRYKLCIPLGTSLEFLRLLLRRYKLCIPLGTSLEFLRLLLRRYKLCIPLGTSLELKTYTALPLERLFVTSATYSAFLRTAFCCFEGFLIIRKSSLLPQIFKLQPLKPVEKIGFPHNQSQNCYMKTEMFFIT